MTTGRLERSADAFDAVSAAVAFMAHFDAGEAEDAAALFAADAVWRRLDGVVTGKAALIELINRRNPTLVVRHLVSNLRTEWRSVDHVVVRSYVTLISHHAATAPPKFPLPFDGVAGFGRYEDELYRIGGLWLIGRKTSVSEFKR